MSVLGFLGVGSMGSGMAARLIEVGHEVRVWNRSPDAVEELVSRGAVAASSPADALAAEVSFSMLANDAAAEVVLTAEAAHSAKGRIHVNMASISPEASTRLAAIFEDVRAGYVAAPVLGRPDVAAAGQLNILAAGASATVDAVEQYLAVLGKRIWRLGEKPGVANAVKVSVNYNIIHALQALGETIAMVERLGVEPVQFVELLSSSLFGGVVYTGYGNEIARQGYYPPGFHIELGRKDLQLAEDVAASSGVTLATMPALIAVFERALADAELSQGDWGAIAEVTRRDLL
ncbi:NAD(P)-dependent oxidoreductase [Parafrigoribacterium humi]|uniref:NAD(P)-dependent oxidoreductase n=1 Tax=Parafrigoribacterium humi TaxID=3144664 RepID=UPI0032ED656A